MSSQLPPEAWVVALSVLPQMGPASLCAALAGRSPRAAWIAACKGELGDRRHAERWRAAAVELDVETLWRRHTSLGVGVAVAGSPAYPSPFVHDLEPPTVVFAVGDLGVICGPRVAVVGTRSATRYGVDIAFELGKGLASAGVAVVSGLALGIDGAAHAGALDADSAAGAGPPIGVVASGLDVVYPFAHRELWNAVAARGVVLSEAPLGTRPERWRFPARNRLIAAIADVVVVVESGEVGGSMHTVEEALRRDCPVMAVPGPIHSPSSEGVNRLLGEGAAPACSVDDVLLALGLTPGVTRPVIDPRPAPSAEHAALLDAVGWQPVSVHDLLARTGLGLGPLLAGLEQLAVDGWVAERAGWYERVARSDG